MADSSRVAGSFRDPSGQVHDLDGRIFRSVAKGAAADRYKAVKDSGFYEREAAAGRLVGVEESVPPMLPEGSADVAIWLEHPRLPFISHPYEWPFELWKKAALLHLDIHLSALESGLTLSDATAYNIQFDGTRPMFIDHLSFRPYEDGEPWIGHHQFCCQFLNPLLLWAKCGVAPNSWMRGSLEGIRPEELAPFLPWRTRLSPTILAHVHGLAAVERQRASGRNGASKSSTRLPKSRFAAILEGLRHYIAGLNPPGGETTWGDYAENTSYSDEETRRKHELVGHFVTDVQPALLVDLGCNSGDYSVTALQNGAGRVIGFDFDHRSLGRAAARADKHDLALTPLWLDAANPSPDQGWAQRERAGLAARTGADALIVLAVIHHIAIGRNVPLDMAVDWLMSIAPAGVIEFPTKDDPMVQTLLAQRDDIFADYDIEHFRAAVEKRGRIVREEETIPGKRFLVRYERAR